ncbi:hypothetical protein [Bdellovibrio sp.]|uniref:hypothetical protein n=1 Tax=Bdellovibrio sp. TaxID=28201 RepID=UPI0039E498F6
MKHLTLLLSVLFLVPACTKTTTSSSEGEIVNESIEGGLWKTDCLASGGIYLKGESSFSGGQYYSSLTVYSDSSCSTASLEVKEVGTYALTGTIAEGLFPKSKIDLTLSTLTTTVWSSSLISSFNSNNHCGISNWSVGETRSILGLICDSKQMGQAGDKFYDIYGVQVVGDSLMGVRAGDLLFGSKSTSYDGSSENKRPVNLSSSLTYRR